MRQTLVFLVAPILVLACTGPATAQEIELSPKMKMWEPVLGKWSGEEELRESPDGQWVKRPLEWETVSGGHYLILRWKRPTTDIEIVGYDPLQDSYISTVFRSDGSRGGVTSMGWDGTTIRLSFTNVTADGEVQAARCTWEHPPDFKSTTANAERFSDGKWWTYWKVQATKVE